MSADTPEVRAILMASFDAYVKRARVVFAPYMGSVEDTFIQWKAEHPEEVAAAIAKAAGSTP